MAGKFSVDLSRLVAKAKGNAGAVVRKTMLDLSAAIVARTPVGDPDTWQSQTPPPGYVGGRARGSWQYGHNTPTAGEPKTVDGTGGPAEADDDAVKNNVSYNRLETRIANAEPIGVHYLTSTVPYMRRLEYAPFHSKQAPAGMVRVTIAEFKDFVEKNCNEVKNT